MFDDNMGACLAVKIQGVDEDASELAFKQAIAEVYTWEDEN